MPDGRVLLVPNQSSTIGLYDPTDDSFVRGPHISSGGFSGGVLCPNGKVVLVPDRATTAVVFDPSTNTATTATRLATGFRGGVLLRDGRVAFVPHSSNVTSGVMLYDPVGDQTQRDWSCCPNEPPVFNPTPDYGAYYGAVVLPNGTVALVPYDAARIGLFTVSVSSKAYNVPTVKAPWNALLLPYYNKF